MKNYYQILGLKEDASIKKLKGCTSWEELLIAGMVSV